jgi:hypothetical protein
MTDDHNQAIIRLLEREQAKDNALTLLFDPKKSASQNEQLQKWFAQNFAKDELATLLIKTVELMNDKQSEINNEWRDVLKDSIRTAYSAGGSDKQSAAASRKANQLWNNNYDKIKMLYTKFKEIHPNNRALVAEKISKELDHLLYDTIYKWLGQIENGTRLWELSTAQPAKATTSRLRTSD